MSEKGSAFAAFMVHAEPRLQRALIARFGTESGRDAALDALVYGWRNWDRVSSMENPVGYLYRVGASSVRKRARSVAPIGVSDAAWSEPWIEPALEPSLNGLSDHQRTVVVLRHSFEWTLEEIADLLGVSVRTVRAHLERGMQKLRAALEVTLDD